MAGTDVVRIQLVISVILYTLYLGTESSRGDTRYHEAIYCVGSHSKLKPAGKHWGVSLLESDIHAERICGTFCGTVLKFF